MGFRWVPGEGVDVDRLSIMKNQVRKPKEPMGEAWFMGEERKLFHELDDDAANLSVEQLQRVLEEIGSGVGSFGLHEEWRAWFDYLLPYLIPRSHDWFVSWLYEETCTTFLQIDLDETGSHATPSRRQNVLLTLGQCLMEAERWHNGSVVLGKVLHRSNRNPAGIWGWRNVSGDLAASMIVCLRLIDVRDIDEWVSSIFAIECPYWRAQILTWYIGAQPVLNRTVKFPSGLDGWTPQIDWSWSHVISGLHGENRVATEIIPKVNVTKFQASFRAALKNTDLNVWKKEILAVNSLRSEIGPFIERQRFVEADV